ncbi:MAG: ATP-binding protein, partial [Saprospiraceae bacterium]|nr:ATP-binding protein [Saprospiraceae bacterium]
IASNMMPVSLTSLGLKAAVEDIAEHLRSDHVLDVRCEVVGLEDRLDEATEIMIYRIVQELSNNVVKHARADQVLIQLNLTEGELFLIVEDNGVGFDPASVDQSASMGMQSLYSRVHYLGGELDLASVPGEGTCVTVRIPIDRKSPIANN